MRSGLHYSFLALCISSALASPLTLATPFTVENGQTLTGRQTLTGNETGDIGEAATLQESGTQAIRWSAAQTGSVTINNQGRILATNGARAIDTQGNTNSSSYHLVLNNAAPALIDSADDAVRLNFSSGLLGSVTINNAGQMYSTTGQVLDFASMQQGSMQLNNQGVMQSVQHDAIRTGDLAVINLNNAGSIQSLGENRRGIDISGNGGERHITLTNQTNAIISAQNDAIRINYDVSAGQVLLNNAGTIQSTGLADNAGQAIDFNSLSGNGVSALIVNQAGALIQTQDADAVRPGGNGQVHNAGIIRAGGAGLITGASSTSADGIDFQQHGGSVFNLAGGLIEAARHGITGSGFISVVNQSGGSIIGHNGSGVNLDGNGLVVNYGIISGRYNPQLADGDGDGIDIDLIGDIENFGLIEGVGAAGVKNGDPNRADGIAMGGGRIINHSAATIYSSDRGILIDDSDGGAAFSATYIVNAGTIDALNEGIQLRGDWNDTLVNSGSIISRNNGVAIDMGGGNDSLELQSGTTIQGSILGGSGFNTLLLTGAEGGSFGSVQQFQHWQVEQGMWQMAAELWQAENDVLQISSAAQLQVAGDVSLNGNLLFNLLGYPLDTLLAVERNLSFGEQFNLTLDLSHYLPQAGDSWSLFSSANLINLSSLSLRFIGNQLQPSHYELFSSYNNNRFEVSFRMLPGAAVSAPASIALLIFGLFALRTFKRRSN
ncbi:MAG: hypothetical protein ACK4GU_10220 [Alishewanella aestuarii]